MKSTILSENDAKLIEKTILKHGRIVRIHDLMEIFTSQYSRASAHNRINLLTRAGWFRRIKQGLYLIIDSLTARAQTDVSQGSIANALMKDSYLSLSYALGQYQMFDQYSTTVASITTKESKKYVFDGIAFTFSKVKKGMYFGFTEQLDHGKKVRIAEAEKALIDYLYLDKSFGSASLVFEKIREHHHMLDLNKLQDYAIRSGITLAREIGFILDALKLDSTKSYKAVQGNRGTSRFMREAKLFNARWRLYYDDRIIG